MPHLEMRFKNRYLLLELRWRDGRPAPGTGAAEAALLAALRDTLGAVFGDVALGPALASLHGARAGGSE